MKPTNKHKPLSHCPSAVQKLFKCNPKAAALTAEGKKTKRLQDRKAYWTRYLTSQQDDKGCAKGCGLNDTTT